MSGQRNIAAPFRAAIDRYGMIGEGDAVAVGVSGGKDSVALLTLLAELRRYYPCRFSLTAITVDPYFDGVPGNYEPIAALCDRLQVPYLWERTHLWEAVQGKSADSPCSLCAKMRRGTLHRVAVEAGCRTVALGHHRDDAAQTVLMNILSGATLKCFSPKSYLDRCGITLIRPMVFLAEEEIAAYVRHQELPVVASRCPVDRCTDRQVMADHLAALREAYGDVALKLTEAWQKAGLNGW